MLAGCWHLLTTGELRLDPGADHFGHRHDPAVEAKRLQRPMEVLEFTVTIKGNAA
jgi:hypothetical protein